MGDVILTLPTCGALRRALPSVKIGMLVSRYVGAIVEHNPLIDAIIWSDDAKGNPVPFHAISRELRGHHFDAAVIARPTPRIAWLVARSGIPLRVGTGYRWYSALFNRRVYDHRKTAERHEVEYNLRLMGALGFEIPDLHTCAEFGITPSAEAKHSVDHILQSFGIIKDQPFVILHPASGGSARDWPPERFCELSTELCSKHRIAVVVTGTVGDEKIVRRVMRGAPAAIVSLAGLLNLPQLIALIDRATVLVANSTGPLHLAVALGTPVVGLYPPVTPMSAKRWGPYAPGAAVLTGNGPVDCDRCSSGDPCNCMLGITVAQVEGEVMRLIDSGRVQDRSRIGS